MLSLRVNYLVLKKLLLNQETHEASGYFAAQRFKIWDRIQKVDCFLDVSVVALRN